jgi:hypothetical protein
MHTRAPTRTKMHAEAQDATDTGRPLTQEERVVLVMCCHDHAVAVCPGCSRPLTSFEMGADFLLVKEDVCPACETRLGLVLRQHLESCTSVAITELLEGGAEVFDRARRLLKHGQTLGQRADVLAREAEVARQRSRDVRRGGPPARPSRGTPPTPQGGGP